MKSIKLAVIGECMIELSTTQDTGQNQVELMQVNFGGDSMNTAIYLKKLAKTAIDIHFVSSMGNDPQSSKLINKWQAFGIDTSSVLINNDKHAGLYMITNDHSGERTFQYWRNDSAAKYMVQHHNFSKTMQKLVEFDAIYLSGISLAILPKDDCEILLAHLTQLEKSGVKIIFDSNYRPALWSNVSDCQKVIEKIYAISTLALVTFDDEHSLWGDTSIEDCHSRLHQQGVSELVIKDGENGCQYSHADVIEKYTTFKINKVVDTTAAGDSFNAGFLAYWLQSYAIKICAMAGNKLAGQVIQQKGAIVNVDIADIVSSISNNI